MITIGDRIKHRRTELGFSQKELANCIGNISSASISLWETGSTKGLKPENLLNAAKCLGKTVEWLVLGKTAAVDNRITHSPLPQKSKKHLLSIINAAEQERLSLQDIELLASIAKHLEHKP